MKKTFLKKAVLIIFVAIVSITNLTFAQNQGSTSNIPEPPPMEVQTDGFGVPSSPIDMYILILAAVAIAFAVYYSKRYVNQKAN